MGAKAIFYEHPTLNRSWMNFCLLNCQTSDGCFFTGCKGEDDKNIIFDLDVKTMQLSPYKKKKKRG